MKRTTLVIAGLFVFCCCFSQFNVRIVVKETTAIKHDSIYLAGSFNNWDSTANRNYRLQPSGPDEKAILLRLPAGRYEYKITRGNWLTVEKDYGGSEVPNHLLTVSKDTTVRDTVAAWQGEVIADKWQTIIKEKTDTGKVKIYQLIANLYTYSEWYNIDSALFYMRKALLQLNALKTAQEAALIRKDSKAGWVNYWVFHLQENLAQLLHSIGNYPIALELRLDNLKIAEQLNYKTGVFWALDKINIEYSSLKDYSSVLGYARRMQAMLIPAGVGDGENHVNTYVTAYFFAEAYSHLNNLDSALFYALQMYNKTSASVYPWLQGKAHASRILGDIYAKRGKDSLAFYYYRASIPLALNIFRYDVVLEAEIGLTRHFKRVGQLDSALHYAHQALLVAQNSASTVRGSGEYEAQYIIEITPLIADLYLKKNQLDSAYQYLQLSVHLKDSVYADDKIRQFQNLTFNESIRQQQEEQKAREKQEAEATRMKFYVLGGGLLLLLLTAILLIRNNRQKQKANRLLSLKNQQIENTLEKLKATQAQLIQSEKMASLGELTAGIAHEIQNPLNFVNNFSEANKEILAELQQAIQQKDFTEAETLAADLQTNEEKIAHHGRRADAIVKSMLQHSRPSQGERLPTNLNALVEEYLRLSYQGMRAKNNVFNTVIETHFDPAVGMVNVLPQDISRVLLNLFNNAFYAVNEKKKRSDENYEPFVQVATKRLPEAVEIRLKDNGTGMPEKVKEKIYQPFFTTKPTGEGTGLGLSLSYDIITKGHGGELKVESKEGEGSTFVVQLPVM